MNEFARLAMSRFALRRRFRAQYGISLTKCVDTLRVERAQRLLRRTKFSVENLATVEHVLRAQYLGAERADPWVDPARVTFNIL